MSPQFRYMKFGDVPLSRKTPLMYQGVTLFPATSPGVTLPCHTLRCVTSTKFHQSPCTIALIITLILYMSPNIVSLYHMPINIVSFHHICQLI